MHMQRKSVSLINNLWLPETHNYLFQFSVTQLSFSFGYSWQSILIGFKIFRNFGSYFKI